MPFAYNLSKIKDLQNVIFDKNDPTKHSLMTKILIWTTIAIGIPKITEDNYEEFYNRMVIDALLNGSSMKEDKTNFLPSLEDVKKHIGLETNASSLSRSEFDDIIKKDIKESSNYRYTWSNKEILRD